MQILTFIAFFQCKMEI